MRKIALSRTTHETDVSLELSLDGTGESRVDTGIGFFDHMLTAFARHSGFDLALTVRGDLQVDCHHTVEDTGIVLGQALGQLFTDKTGLARYGSFYVPMDEALAFCALDISGRAYLVFHAVFEHPYMGGMETAMVEEFFRAVATQAGLTLHIKVLYGANDHHKTEAIFKAFAHALSIASRVEGERLLSTKGVL